MSSWVAILSDQASKLMRRPDLEHCRPEEGFQCHLRSVEPSETACLVLTCEGKPKTYDAVGASGKVNKQHPL